MTERSALRAILIGAAPGVRRPFSPTRAACWARPRSAASAAGDMSAGDAILWTRTFDPSTGQPAAVAVTAQLAAEPQFRDVLFIYRGNTDPARDGTLKIDATGLNSHTRYFYRFVSGDGTISPAGQFATAPATTREWRSALPSAATHTEPGAHFRWSRASARLSSIISSSSATRSTKRRVRVRPPRRIRFSIPLAHWRITGANIWKTSGKHFACETRRGSQFAAAVCRSG